MKSAGVSPVIQDGNVLLKLRVKGEGVTAGLEIEQCTYKLLWVYQTLPPAPRKTMQVTVTQSFCYMELTMDKTSKLIQPLSKMTT